MQQQNIEPVMSLFAKLRKTFESTLKNLGMESEPALTAAEDMLRTEIAPTLAYLDAPRHPMAPSLFICAMHLAVFKTVRSQDVDSHTYGVAMLDSLAAAPAQPEGSPPPTLDGPGTHAGEFQVDVLEVDDARGYGRSTLPAAPYATCSGSTTPCPWYPTCAPAMTWSAIRTTRACGAQAQLRWVRISVTSATRNVNRPCVSRSNSRIRFCTARSTVLRSSAVLRSKMN